MIAKNCVFLNNIKMLPPKLRFNRKILRYCAQICILYGLFCVYINRRRRMELLSNIQNNCGENVDNEAIFSHALQNDCHYAILMPTEFDLVPYVHTVRSLYCSKVQMEFR